MPKAIFIHGGAWAIPDAQVEDNKKVLTRALDAGWGVLERGGSALDAIVAAIVVLEDDPILNAGYGSLLTREGKVEMDAAVMDGRTLGVGACAVVSRIKNPILLARNILESENVLMVAEGAEQFARERGTELIDPKTMITPEQFEMWQAYLRNPPTPTVSYNKQSSDTVGAVALDERGNIAAGNSTGGRDFKMPGRVGDSPIVGCGFYADNLLGGAACTGWGEPILRTVMAKSALDFLKFTDPMTAAQLAVQKLERVKGSGGVILVDSHGHIGYAYSTPRMARAWRIEGDTSEHVEV